MSVGTSSIPGQAAVEPRKVLRQLYKTLFLRGRSSRGLNREETPQSVGRKLIITSFFYALFGLMALAMLGQSVFRLAVYLHGMTSVFLGMYVAASSGEILFNLEEADILLHRPVEARDLLWAKVSVMLEVSLWLAGAMNLAGFVVGTFIGGWIFLLAHLVSTVMEALFCIGAVVMVYQLCLRWFGRERLNSLMTTAQVLVSVVAVLGGQIFPRMMIPQPGAAPQGIQSASAWMWIFPPAWFAGFDEALAGKGTATAWMLAAIGVAATVVVIRMAFGTLAGDYQSGLQILGEGSASRPRRAGRRWVDRLADTAPFRWWLREPGARAGFLLAAAYLIRDRDLKLRLYPGVAPLLVMPIIFLTTAGGRESANLFMIAFSGFYLATIPLVALDILQYSSQWAAADLFRLAPLSGPAGLCHGARRAVLVFLVLPTVLILLALITIFSSSLDEAAMVVPGLLTLPLFAIVPHLRSAVAPLSLPNDGARSSKRAIVMLGAMIFGCIIAGLTQWAWRGGFFLGLVVIETAVVLVAYAILRARAAGVVWETSE